MVIFIFGESHTWHFPQKKNNAVILHLKFRFRGVYLLL